MQFICRLQKMTYILESVLFNVIASCCRCRVCVAQDKPKQNKHDKNCVSNKHCNNSICDKHGLLDSTNGRPIYEPRFISCKKRLRKKQGRKKCHERQNLGEKLQPVISHAAGKVDALLKQTWQLCRETSSQF